MIIEIPLEKRVQRVHTPSQTMHVSEVGKEVIAVENVRLYGRDQTYPVVFVHKQVLQDSRRSVQKMTRYTAIKECEAQDMILPPASVLCCVLAALSDARDKLFVRKFLTQFKDHVLTMGTSYGLHHTNTLVSFKEGDNHIIDYPADADFTIWGGHDAVNEGLRETFSFQAQRFESQSLATLLESRREHFIEYVRLLSGLDDPARLIPLGEYLCRPAFVSIPPLQRNTYREKNVWVGCNQYALTLSSTSLYQHGLVRPVEWKVSE